jgi:hypothetical protein
MTQDLSRNANRFIIFTVLFTARAYYPVLAVLFIDLGLTLDQFVFLNLIWAATIFLFEVPSGALADTIGRRRLLIAASIFMTIEMLCLLMAPVNGGALLLTLCVINRICSGLSEACASGADQALAYDSLPEQDRTNAWDTLLGRAMRWRSIGFVIAMIVGGLLYDADVLNKLLPNGLQLTDEGAHRLPVALVLGQALVCLLICLRMVEPGQRNNAASVSQVVRLTLSTAHWVFTHRVTLVVILLGVAVDSIVRNFATIDSSYFRLIALPDWTFGLIGAALGGIWWFVPAIAQRLNARYSMYANMAIVMVGTFVGLVLIWPCWAYYGLLPASFLFIMMGLLEFTVSRTLNAEAKSERRATVLSVKGLVFNLGYGLFSLAFSLLLAGFPDEPAGASLRNALWWEIPYFALMSLGLLIWARIHLRKPQVSEA